MMFPFAPYTPEAAAAQFEIIKTTVDIGEQISDTIKWQEDQKHEMEISFQANNYTIGDGGNDDDEDSEGEDDDSDKK